MRKIIYLFLLLICLYLGFKYYGYTVNNDSRFHDLAVVKFEGKMTINKIPLSESEYIKYENFKVKNIFDGYELINDKNNALKYRIIGKETDAIFMGIDNEFVTQLKDDPEYKNYTTKLFNENNINNDLDLLRFFEKHNDDKITFFMTFKNQNEIRKLKEINSLILPSLQYVKEIDGDYNGYILKTTDKINEVNILIDGKRYFFTFIGDYEESFINDFMNTLVIEN